MQIVKRGTKGKRGFIPLLIAPGKTTTTQDVHHMVLFITTVR